MSNEFLEALKENSEQPAARRVAQRLADIELALVHGYTHRQILAQLHLEGIVLTSDYYHRLITRLRRRARAAKAKNPAQQIRGSGLPGSGAGVPCSSDPGGSTAEQRNQLGEARTHDLSVAIASSPDPRTGTILEKSPPIKPFTWDPKAARDYNLKNI